MKRRSVLSLFGGAAALTLVSCKQDFISNSLSIIGLQLSRHIGQTPNCWEETFFNELALSDKQIHPDHRPLCEVILGGLPLRGFPSGKQFLDDARNQLYRDFVRIVAHLRPRAFLLENVLGMEAMVFDQVVESFEAAGYIVTANRALATDFGVARGESD